MTREERKQEARRHLKDYAEEHLQKSKSGLFNCPFCPSGTGPHGTGAFSVKGETWRCFACNAHGDIFDLHGGLNGTDEKTAFQEVYSLYGLVEDGRTGAPAARDAFTEQPEDFTAFYEKAAAGLCLTDYHKRRGISDETARRFMLGYVPNWKHPKAPAAVPETPRLIVPISRTTYAARDTRPDAPKDYAKQKAGTGSWMFNAKALQAEQPVFVCEGEIDAISFEEVGAPAVAIGSTSYTNMFAQLIDAQKPAQPLIIALDSDPAGLQAADEMEADLRSKGVSFYRCNDLYGREKDANAALCADREAFIKSVREAQQEALQPEHEREMLQFLQKVQGTAYRPAETGINAIDRALCGGFFRQALVLLGGAPGMGKSALTQWLLEHMAARGASCLYYALEMSREQMLARSLSRRIWKATGRDMGALDVLQGFRWTDDQRKTVQAAVRSYRDELGGRMVYRSASADLDFILSDMEAAAIRQEARGQAAPIVCVDYLHLLQGKDREDDAATIKRATKALKDFAIKHDTAVVVISANNRASNAAGKSDLNAGRDTSSIEYSADIHLGLEFTAIDDGRKDPDGKLYTPDKINDLKRRALERGEKPPTICSEISLRVNKNRFGEAGRRARLLFDGRHSVFEQAELWHMFAEDTEEEAQTTGNTIKAHRGKQTRQTVADKTGISALRLAKLEAGTEEATEEELKKIAAYFTVSVEDLQGR